MKANRLIALTGLLLFGIISKSSAQIAWETDGNALATPNTDFIGTTTDNDLVIKRNSVLSGTVGLTFTSFGNATGAATTRNTFIGAEAGHLATSFAADDTYVGYKAGGGSYQGTASGLGLKNTALGSYAGFSNAGGKENVYLGYEAGKSTGYGYNNVMIGSGAGRNNASGYGNIFIGRNAGYFETNSNKLYIDNSNTATPLIFGEFDTRKLTFNVSGSSASKVEIKSSAAGTSGLAFTNLSSASSATANTNGKFLTVGANGDVILESIPAGSGNNLYNNDGILAANRTVGMADHTLVFDTDDNGRIYVGNNTPTFPTTSGNYRLYVEGGIMTEKVKVALPSSANWADYVFANDYKLMSLADVEAFAKLHKHLPKVASSEELAKTGLDIAAMQSKQMEKIEELTLYLIEQNKKLENQGKEIQVLKDQVKALLENK